MEYDIIDTGPDKDYDNLTYLAATLCDVSIAKISIIGKDTVWTKSIYGGKLQDFERKDSFCDKVIYKEEPIVIFNKSNSPEIFAQTKELTGMDFGFYAGIPLYNPQGHPIAVFCVFDKEEKTLTDTQIKSLLAIADQVMNLFEFRKQKLKFYEVQKKLRNKYNELEKFTSLVSHDIKSPLANIISLSELLKEENKGKFDEETEKYLEYLVESSYALRNYVDGILSFYRSDHVMEKDYVNVDLHMLLKGIIDFYEMNDDVEITYPDDVMLQNVNKAALTQIFMNLVSNALKYNKQKIRKVHINFSKQEGFYCFEVKDNGEGIPKEKIEEIFELFTTLDTTDRDGNTGSGIGLATVKKLVNSMGGRIDVESVPGEGSTFSFSVKRI